MHRRPVSAHDSRMAVCAVALVAAVVSVTGAGTGAGAASSPRAAHSRAVCIRDSLSAGTARLPMPTPQQVSRTTVWQWPNTITLAPPAPGDTSVAVAPRTVWHEATKLRGATYRLFLAVYSSSIPATEEPNGTLVPLEDRVLSWVVLGEHVPFNTALAARTSSEAGGPPKDAPCTFTGFGLQAWNATTGAQVADGGGSPSHPEPLGLHLVRWEPPPTPAGRDR